MNFLSDFGLNPLLLAAQVVNFLVLLWILKRFLYKPILRVLDDRKKKIEESLKNAEEIEVRLQETNDKIDRMMVKAADEIQKMHDEAKKDIEALKKEGKLRAEEAALVIINKGEESSSAATEKMKEELMSHLADMVAAGMEKVAGEILDRKSQREIIEKEVKNLS